MSIELQLKFRCGFTRDAFYEYSLVHLVELDPQPIDITVDYHSHNECRGEVVRFIFPYDKNISIARQKNLIMQLYNNKIREWCNHEKLEEAQSYQKDYYQGRAIKLPEVLIELNKDNN